MRAVLQYTTDEALPRVRRILFSAHALYSIALALLAYRYAASWPIANIRPVDLLIAILTYGATVLALSIAAMALVLTFPNRDFVSILMQSRLGDKQQSAYGDLLFVFSWTAIVHWLMLVLTVSTVLVRGPEGHLLNVWDGIGYRILVGALLAIVVYAASQFLLTIITLTQVGRVYEAELKQQVSERKRHKEDFIKRSVG